MNPEREAPCFLAITGPTTSGKTELSIQVAEALGGEILSMDSRQVYRGMDIGTDKVGSEERARVPHHGLDLVDPDQKFSAGEFARYARRVIGEVRERSRVPILVGVTGFFLRALMDPLFAEPDLDPDRRIALRDYLAKFSAERLADWVAVLDPWRANLAREGGTQRLLRTLEIALMTGVPLSRWHEIAQPAERGLSGCVVVIEVPREELDRRITARVQRMVERGFLEEVRRLLDAGYGPADPGMTGTGYREVAQHLRGERDLEDALEEMARQTRQYARRQLTWFRGQLPAKTTPIDGLIPLEDRCNAIVQVWEGAASGEEGIMSTTGATL